MSYILFCILLRYLKVNNLEMTEAEEETLRWGLNDLHDAGSVHASDLQKVTIFLPNSLS